MKTTIFVLLFASFSLSILHSANAQNPSLDCNLKSDSGNILLPLPVTEVGVRFEVCAISGLSELFAQTVDDQSERRCADSFELKPWNQLLSVGYSQSDSRSEKRKSGFGFSWSGRSSSNQAQIAMPRSMFEEGFELSNITDSIPKGNGIYCNK